METITLRNPELQRKYEYIVKNYYSQMKQEQASFVRLVIVNFKKNSNDEKFIILILLYWLIFFKQIWIDHYLIDQENKEYIETLQTLYRYEMLWDKEKFMEWMLWLSCEMLQLKMLIKYTVLVFEDKSQNIIISNRSKYFESIGYMLPLLTLRESKLLGYFQDAYFKQLYPDQYIKTKMVYLDKMKKAGSAWEYIISIINWLEDVMTQAWVIWKVKMRKKTIFSIYNKILRKSNTDFLDSIWVRIIFKELTELAAFVELFENKFVYMKKKDYISEPKENGYQSLHYSFLTPYGNNEIYVELQLRTIDMDQEISNAKEISHFTYSIKKNKWAELFSEVHFWYKYLLDYIDRTQWYE